jgi:DNA replication protein DnaC
LTTTDYGVHTLENRRQAWKQELERQQIHETKPAGDVAESLKEKAHVANGGNSEIKSYGIKAPKFPRLTDLDTSVHPLMESAVATTRKWCDRKCSGVADASLILLGPVGTGKTHIARSIFWAFRQGLDDGTPTSPLGDFYHASNLMMKMSPTKDKDTGMTETPRPANFIGSKPLLVIDDIGTEQKLPYIAADDQQAELQARYFSVIDYCYQRVSLIITSNLNARELANHLGPRCWDRLNEMAPSGYMLSLASVPSWRVRRSGR